MNPVFSKKELSLEELKNLAVDFKNKIRPFEIILLEGPMGAGKTTFSRYLVEALGSTDFPNSPTYAIYNEYKAFDNKSIYHIDLYRIKDFSELEGFGFWQLLEEEAYLLIEWSNMLKESVWPVQRPLSKLQFDINPYQISCFQS